MNTLLGCKFLYLKEISFAVKGELPSYACEKEHDISTKCSEFCSDSDITISSRRRFLFEDFIINKIHAAYLKMLANGHKIIANGVYEVARIIVGICILLHLISKRVEHKSS